MLLSKSFRLSLIRTNRNSNRVNTGQLLVLAKTGGTGRDESFATIEVSKTAGVDMIERTIITNISFCGFDLGLVF